MSSDKPRLWTPDFIVLLLISLLAFIGCQALSNGIPIYVRGYEGFPACSSWSSRCARGSPASPSAG